MSDFKKFKEKLPSKENFYSSLFSKIISGKKKHKDALNIRNKFEIKTMKPHLELYLKFNNLL